MTPTPKLRWVKRRIPYDYPSREDILKIELVLQQWWNDSVGQDDCGGEWRDVPIEEEAT
jgi:hypothetical protein